LRWPAVAAAVAVQLAPEWVRQAWGVPPLAAERQPLEAARRRVRWAADRRDRTTLPAMERPERATQAGMQAAVLEMTPMRRRG